MRARGRRLSSRNSDQRWWEVGAGPRNWNGNIHAKKKRIKAGSGEKMRKVGSKGAPTSAAFKQAAKTAKKPKKKSKKK